MTNTSTGRKESVGQRSETSDYHSQVQALAAERAELRAADNAVRLARAAWRASTTDENAQRVADLIAARDLIKAAGR